MKKLLAVFDLDRPEQRLIIFILLMMLALAWFKNRPVDQPQAADSGATVSSPTPLQIP